MVPSARICTSEPNGRIVEVSGNDLRYVRRFIKDFLGCYNHHRSPHSGLVPLWRAQVEGDDITRGQHPARRVLNNLAALMTAIATQVPAGVDDVLTWRRLLMEGQPQSRPEMIGTRDTQNQDQEVAHAIPMDQ